MLSPKSLKIKKVVIENCLTNELLEISVKSVINATGPFADALRKVAHKQHALQTLEVADFEPQPGMFHSKQHAQPELLHTKQHAHKTTCITQGFLILRGPT